MYRSTTIPCSVSLTTPTASRSGIRRYRIRRLKYNEGLTFIIGSLTPDQQWYYGREAGEAIGQPVLLLDVEWTDKLLALYDDIPYGEEPQRIVPADDSKS